MTETEARVLYANKACEFLQTKQGDERHKYLVDVYNSIEPHPNNYIATYDENWCGIFVTAIADILGFSLLFPRHYLCRSIMNNAPYFTPFESKQYNPMIGDLLFFDWEYSGKPEHVGIICSNNESSMRIVEGNYRHRVLEREIATNSEVVYGYATLDWKRMIATRVEKYQLL